MKQKFTRITPAEAGLDPRCIISMMDRMERQGIDLTGFMLLRHGKLLCEAAWAPYTSDQLRTVYSLSKTFTSMAVGIAWGEGRIGLDEKVADIFSDEIGRAGIPAGPELSALTVRHLLTMSTGQEQEPFHQPDAWADMVTAFLKEPFHEVPGTVFRYNTAATYMLSAILNRKGIDLETYLQEKLFTPMGITGTRWLRDPKGICTGGFGLSLYLSVIAGLGQLILQEGNWEGRQLIPKEYIALATSRQIRNGDDPKSEWAQGYGFQMWMCRYGAFRGDGMYGQLCLIHPATGTVLAMNAVTDDMQGEMNAYFDEVLLQFQDAPLPEDEQAMHELEERLKGLRYKRELPEDDGSVLPQQLCRIDLPLADFFSLHLEAAGDRLVLTDETGKVRYEADRGSWRTIRRSVHCDPLFTKDPRETPAMGCWAMHQGSLIVKVYEPEFVEEDTLVLTPEADGVYVKLSNTTIPAKPEVYCEQKLSL